MLPSAVLCIVVNFFLDCTIFFHLQEQAAAAYWMPGDGTDISIFRPEAKKGLNALWCLDSGDSSVHLTCLVTTSSHHGLQLYQDSFCQVAK